MTPKLVKTLLGARSDVTALVQTGASFFMASRAIAYVAMALGGIVSVATLLTAYVQIERMEQQNELINTQNALAEAQRSTTMTFELSNFLNGLRLEDGNDDLLIVRAAALSRALRPYPIRLRDGTLSLPRSPERGQLLLSLLAAKVDAKKLAEAGATFEYADLQGANLSGADLSGLNLKNAILTEAQMKDVTLKGTNLSLALLPRHLAISIQDLDEIDLNLARVPTDTWLADVARYNWSSYGEAPWAHERSSQNSQLYFPAVAMENAEYSRLSVPTDQAASLLKWENLESTVFFKWQTLGLTEWLERAKSILGETSNPNRKLTIKSHRKIIEFHLSALSDLALAADFPVIGAPQVTQLFELLGKHEILMPNLNFSGMSPGGVSNPLRLSGVADLAATDFSYADLRYVDFGQSNLSGSFLVEALLPPYAMIKNADLTNATFLNTMIPTDWPISEAPFAEMNPVKKCLVDAVETSCAYILNPTAKP